MQKITLTQQDAKRLEDLLQTVVRAFHQILEARRRGSDGQQLLMDELEYDFFEMLAYEKAFELERSMPPRGGD